MKSIGQMIRTIAGLVGTDDLSGWEDEFVQNVIERTSHGALTTGLSDKQTAVIERIYKKHFA